MSQCPPRYSAYLASSKRQRQRTPIVDPRARSQIGQRAIQSRPSTQQRCTTQTSPDRTPSYSAIVKTELLNCTNVLICEKPVTPNQVDNLYYQQPNYNQFFQSTQIKRSPSFRLKNYHQRDQQTEIVRPYKRPSIHNQQNTQQDVRLNRINVLGNMLDQMESQEPNDIMYPIKKTDKTQDKNSLVSDLATVPKHKLTINEQDQNMEELHFFLVQSQQRSKMLSFTMEGKQFTNV